MDRELNDFGSGVDFARTSASLSGFSLSGSAIRECKASVWPDRRIRAGGSGNAPPLLKPYYESNDFQPPADRRPPDGGPALAGRPG